MPSDDGVDFDEVALGEEGEVFFERGEGKLEGPVEGGLAEDLTDEGVEVGGVVEAVVVAIQGEADDSEDEDLPKVHAGATGGFVGGVEGTEDFEDVAVDLGGGEDPLQGGEGGRKFVARFGGDFDLFDGDGSESELDVE